jgi:polyisoprenoid-binding protein YceI
LKKILFIPVLIFALSLTAQAQERYFTKTGNISFFSKAPLEDIEAKNGTATAVLDTKTGALQFAVLMKGFEFKKALMQEHFNENYVESGKFPKADFKGTIVNNADVNYSKPGTYATKVKGKLTIHGITKDVETAGTIHVELGELKATSTFTIQLSDYSIKVPALVKDKVSNNIKIIVDTKLELLKK